MELAVIECVNATEEANAAAQYGAMGLRIFQVNADPSYMSVTTPQLNLSASIAWGRASASNVPWMSAMCYFYGRNQIVDQPDIPVGMIGSSWGGTPIEYWMSGDALKSCGEGEETVKNVSASYVPMTSSSSSSSSSTFMNPDPGLHYLRAARSDMPQGMRHTPQQQQQQQPAANGINSCLYNSMIYPLLTLPVTGWLWYQGEANAGNPVGYARCFPTMIQQWRADNTARSGGASDPDAPFIFAQLSSWCVVKGDDGIRSGRRKKKEEEGRKKKKKKG